MQSKIKLQNLTLTEKIKLTEETFLLQGECKRQRFEARRKRQATKQEAIKKVSRS